jgi:hypothetical protein
MSDFLDDRLAALGSTPVPPLAPAELVRRRGEQRRTRARLAAGAAGLALVFAAGATAYGMSTGGDPGALQYAPPRTGQPSPAPSATPATEPTVAPAIGVAGPPAAGDVVLAVGGGPETLADGTTATRSLSLYRLRAGSVSAEPVRTLIAPLDGASLLAASVSAGPTPTTCAIWYVDRQNIEAGRELRCYRWGDSKGTAVKASSDASIVALSADGRSLAWVNNNGGNNPMLRIGRVEGAQVTNVREYLGDPTQPATAFTSSGVGGLAWAGPGALAIDDVADSDEGQGLVRYVLGTPQRGWLRHDELVVPVPAADRQRGYYVYDGVRSATSTTAWAIERPTWMDDTPPVGKRAVEIELPSGRIKQVVSEPAEGRDVVEVSGGSRAVVYVTAKGGTDRRVYVRYPGESRGTEIKGMPDNTLIVAGG